MSNKVQEISETSSTSTQSAFKKVQIRYRRCDLSSTDDIQEIVDFCNPDDDERIIKCERCPASCPTSKGENKGHILRKDTDGNGSSSSANITQSAVTSNSRNDEIDPARHKALKTSGSISSSFKRDPTVSPPSSSKRDNGRTWSEMNDTSFQTSPHDNDNIMLDGNDKIYNGPKFELESFPGFLYFPQALSTSVQLELAYRALAEYCEQPHATNIDLIPPKQDEQVLYKEEGVDRVLRPMWEIWKKENAPHIKCESMNGAPGKERIASKKQKARTQKQKYYRCLEKLSWSTMGYHYDWTARAYNENSKSPIPSSLERLSRAFALHCGCDNDDDGKDVNKGRTLPRYKPSAAIVNFYNIKSIMGSHRDDLELDFSKPVVSISIGCPAIFLLGGNIKEDLPVIPILVRPGDVMVLGGSSRLRYHGMARVLPPTIALPTFSKDAEHTQICSLADFEDETKKSQSTMTHSGNGNDADDEGCYNGADKAASNESSANEKKPHGKNSDGTHVLNVEQPNKLYYDSFAHPSHSKAERSEVIPPFELDLVSSFLSNHRININVRQVLPDGVDKIPC